MHDAKIAGHGGGNQITPLDCVVRVSWQTISALVPHNGKHIVLDHLVGNMLQRQLARTDKSAARGPTQSLNNYRQCDNRTTTTYPPSDEPLGNNQIGGLGTTHHALAYGPLRDTTNNKLLLCYPPKTSVMEINWSTPGTPTDTKLLLDTSNASTPYGPTVLTKLDHLRLGPQHHKAKRRQSGEG